MKRYQMDIEANVVSALERLNYEYEMRKDNVIFLLDAHKDDPNFLDTPMFKRYQSEEAEAKSRFEKGKAEFEDAYVPAELKGHRIEWSLDYNKRALTITQLCDCEVGLEA